MKTSNQGIVVVNDLMTGDLVTVNKNDSIELARDYLIESGLHVLPVLDDSGQAVGVISLHDIYPDVSLSELVASIMSTPVTTIEAMASVSTAASMMRSDFIHHLIVVDGDNTVGIITSYDLLFLLDDEGN